MNVRGTNLPGLDIPSHDSITLVYVGSTNNVSTATYKKGNTTVAVLTFTYIADGAADDDLIETITKTNS